MKKRFFLGVATLLLTYSAAVGQVSLLNEATNGLFHNVNDFIIKPNVMFNTVDTKQFVVGGGFDNLGFESNTTGGGVFGYYHPSEIRWSVLGSLDMVSPEHTVSEEHTTAGKQSGTSLENKNPAFSDYSGYVRFNLGLPDTMNLSAGVVTHFNGKHEGSKEITKIDHDKGSAETVEIGKQTKTFNMLIGVPVGLAFSPSVYNLFEPIIYTSHITTINGGPKDLDASSEETKDKTTAFMLYDKLTIQDLLPAPFGSETAFWIGIGNAQLHTITELERPAYALHTESAVDYKVNFSTQLGASNLMDLSVGAVKLRFKPMVYIDLMVGKHKSSTFGVTIAAPSGTYVPLGKLPLALFFGVTPGFQFYTSALGTETSKDESRALTTNVFWTGKIGTSILLPRDITLDMTFNVNTNDKSLGLSAQMSVAL